MADPRPLWRQAFDSAEKFVGPKLELVVRTDEFVRATALSLQAQAALGRRLNAVTAKLWHLVNLPAGTDVLRLRAQVGALDREVRRLTLRLEQEQQAHRVEERTDDAPDQPDGRPGPHPPRGGTQRAADS